MFIPFGFSGTGKQEWDVEPATLLFPNDEQGLGRTIVSEALRGEDINQNDPEAMLPYIAKVEVMMINVETTNGATFTPTQGSAVALTGMTPKLL